METEDSHDGSSGEVRGPVRVHEPVLLREVLEVLALAPGMIVVDGTVGAGGHARAIAETIGTSGLLLGLDRDAEILACASASLGGDAEARARFRLFQLPYSRMQEALAAVDARACDRVLLDLGVSSLQLDSPRRGFSFMHDAPLDMRMDASAPETAADWLAHVSAAELERVLREYGEERYARRIAREVLTARKRGGMTRTTHLVDAVARAVPSAARRQRIHPATRTFQAIRIAVNDELGELERGLAAARACLSPEGRLAVISFHSLEDRMVKQFMRQNLRPLHRKPVTASPHERQRNPRSRSAKLRCGIATPATAARDAGV